MLHDPKRVAPRLRIVATQDVGRWLLENFSTVGFRGPGELSEIEQSAPTKWRKPGSAAENGTRPPAVVLGQTFGKQRAASLLASASSQKGSVLGPFEEASREAEM